MHNELDSEQPELPIQMLGCNEEGHEFGNDMATGTIDIPWLQDVDADNDNNSDTWEDWSAILRDYVIVDRNNVELTRVNLTTNSLAIPENYELVKGLMIEAALFTLLGDMNRDESLDLLDVEPFVEAITSGVFQFEGDINGDGAVDLLDVQPFVNLLTGN